MKRKPITDRMKVCALFYWHTIRCDICREPISSQEDIDWDHIHALGLGGQHDYTNITPLHRACHRAKTRGTGATTAGSDIGKISKVKRIVRTQKMVVRKPYLTDADLAVFDRALRKSAKIIHKAKRKIPSRGFEQGKRPMRRRAHA